MSAIEFLTHILPFALVGRLSDRLGVGRDRIANANAFGQIQDPLPDFLHRWSVFRLHRDESIGNHSPEQECNSRPFGEVTAFLGPDVFAPVDRAELIERAEYFIWQRNHHIFDFLRHLLDVDSLRRGRGASIERYSKQRDYAEFQTFRKGYHRQLRLLISA